MSEQAYIEALVKLHESMERQGPGDNAFALQIMRDISPRLPRPCKMIDLGCGSGSSSLLFAKAAELSALELQIEAVDLSKNFIQALRDQVALEQLSDKLIVKNADFSRLPEILYPSQSYQLLWSEAAAHHLGFAEALALWRPLLSEQGIAVVSELSWQSEQAASAAQSYWQTNYPAMASEHANIEAAKAAGFEVLEVRRLPAKAWWDNYYMPLLKRMQHLRLSLGMNASEAMYDLLDDTDREIQLFDQYSDSYGYSYYILKIC